MEQITLHLQGSSERREALDAAAKLSLLAQWAEPKPMAAPAQARPRVSLRALAEGLEMDRSSCRRYILRVGVKPIKLRTPDSGFQPALTVGADEAARLWFLRKSEGYIVAEVAPGGWA